MSYTKRLSHQGFGTSLVLLALCALLGTCTGNVLPPVGEEGGGPDGEVTVDGHIVPEEAMVVDRDGGPLPPDTTEPVVDTQTPIDDHPDNNETLSEKEGPDIPERPREEVPTDGVETFRPVSLKSQITAVQPMTGLVLWSDHDSNTTKSIQLEYSYMAYNDVVQTKGKYDWTKVEALLNQIKARGHQAILRFWDTYPGKSTTIPQYIKQLPGYQETVGQSEGETTSFPDWSNNELKQFILEFYSQFAANYDKDPRLAFLQVGFGLWAEYHIYDGPMVLGKTFPSKDYQTTFLNHLATTFTQLPWSISIDAAETERTPFADTPDLLKLHFGLFDDSFLHKEHNVYNASCFQFFGLDRYLQAPIGGELSYYTDYDQEHALDPKGPYGISFETLAQQYHVTYMIGNDQPSYQTMSRIQAAGMALGYKFKVVSYLVSPSAAKVTIANTGIAPIYYDAYVAINGIRSTQSLKGLAPGKQAEYLVPSGGANPVLTIESDRLVSGQQIQVDADL